MLQVLLFQCLLLTVSGYAFWRGGAPERVVAVLFVVAGLLSIVGGIPVGRYVTIDLEQFAVDLGLFLALLGVALFANRFWPLWVAALQLLAVAAHLVRLYDPIVLPDVYVFLLSKLAYPICLALVLGTRHYRYRHLRGDTPRDWAVPG